MEWHRADHAVRPENPRDVPRKPDCVTHAHAWPKQRQSTQIRDDPPDPAGPSASSVEPGSSAPVAGGCSQCTTDMRVATRGVVVPLPFLYQLIVSKESDMFRQNWPC